MGFFREFIKNMAVGGYANELSNLVVTLESFSADELVQAKVAAATALAYLVVEDGGKRDSEIELMINVLFEAERKLEKGEIERLINYNRKLITLYRLLGTKDGVLEKLTCYGIPVWIGSIRAAITVEVRPYAKRVWALLDSCDHTDYYIQLGELQDHLGGHRVASKMGNLGALSTPTLFAS